MYCSLLILELSKLYWLQYYQLSYKAGIVCCFECSVHGFKYIFEIFTYEDQPAKIGTIIFYYKESGMHECYVVKHISYSYKVCSCTEHVFAINGK